MMQIVDPRKSCRSNLGSRACIYLTVGSLGSWSCGRTQARAFSALTARLEDDDYMAKGQGAWVECQLKTTSQKEK